MRRLIVLVLVATLGWSVYWAVAASSLQRGIDTGLENAAASGWTADVSAVDVKGFPNRLDTFATDVTIAPPDGGFEWVLPQFQAFALSYRPNEVIAVWPLEHQLTLAGQTLNITTKDMRASAKFGASTDVPLQSATLVADTLQIAAPGGAGALSNLRLALQDLGGDTPRYRIGGEVLQLALPGLPVFERLWLDGVAVLDGPLNRHLSSAAVSPTALEQLKLELAWGGVSLKAEGDVSVRSSGTLDGAINLSVSDWPTLLSQLQSAQIVTQEQALQARQALSMMAGGADQIELPLTISNGRVLIGPIPLAVIPPLKLR